MNTLAITHTKGITRIQFNRPEVLNAFNEPMLLELHQVLKKIETDPDIKVLILSGAGRAFSAGVDLKSTKAEGFQQGGSFMELGLEVGNLLSNMSKVTIAQVHGYCFTGALELMLFLDMAFCGENTQFGDTHTKWAVMPRWGMTQRLARRVGLAKAKELSFRAMRIKGVEAERIGLVNRAFPEEQLEKEVDSIAQEILGNSFEAIRAIKDLYNRGYETTLKEGLEIESQADSKLGDTVSQLSQFQQKKFSDKG